MWKYDSLFFMVAICDVNGVCEGIAQIMGLHTKGNYHCELTLFDDPAFMPYHLSPCSIVLDVLI